MDVELPSLQTAIRDVENLKLSDNGIATWDAISAAGSYEVRIYRDDKAVGASMVVDTNTCNCRDRMTKGDSSYTVKVRPVSRFEDVYKRQISGRVTGLHQVFVLVKQEQLRDGENISRHICLKMVVPDIGMQFFLIKIPFHICPPLSVP